ncbi:AAA family ATPase [Iamia majanohamensis]|uniref:AAA family ATPase n=1 Tax=Iamia majanohamensis TaxID=467976 RepID=A0AAE9YAN2_9ACTN|nr:AAA family ATPase [Iamia majanohamensis]WCO68941.1 AAA family ATPase [Iamia majanohamensis]
MGSYPERLQKLIELQASVSEAQRTNVAYASELRDSWMDLTQKREEFEHERSRFDELGGSRVVRLLDALDGPKPEDTESIQHTPPDSLIAAIAAEFERTGHEFPERDVERLLVAHFTSVATGFLVVFGGPPGAGKSSVARLLPQMLGEECTITAVRPGWLDATDLLGYFNPDRQEFQPSPVLSFIHQASRDRPSAPSVLTLDEMNLARIENYAADLLSELEYSRQARGGKLHLYGTQRAASEQLLTDIVAGASLSEIEESLMAGAIPPTLSLPPGLCLQGTLNEDATTHELSPKVRDRCLAIRVEHAPVRLFREAQPEAEAVCTAACSWVANVARTPESGVARTVQDRWEAALALSAEPGAPPLSHRTARCLEHVPALSELLQLTPERVSE